MVDESRRQAKTRKRRGGVILKDRKSCEELRQRLGIDSVLDVLRRNRLRWFGHVERKNDDDWVKACQRLEVVEVAIGRGGSKKRKMWTRGENVLRRTCGYLG